MRHLTAHHPARLFEEFGGKEITENMKKIGLNFRESCAPLTADQEGDS